MGRVRAVASGWIDTGRLPVINVGDFGTINSTNIQAAIDSAPSTGATVYIPEGTGIIDATITISNPLRLLLAETTLTGSADPIISITSSNVSIVGIHHGVSIVQNTATDANVITTSDGLNTVLFQDIQVDAGGKTADTSERAKGNCIYCIGLTGSKNTYFKVVRCKFIDGHNGFMFDFTDHTTITDCTFDFSHAGIAQCRNWSSDFCVVNNNVFLDSGAADNAIFFSGADGDSPSYCTVSNNTITGTYDSECLHVNGLYCNIDGNVINATTTATAVRGIQIGNSSSADGENSHHIVVSNNTINIADSVKTHTGILVNDDSGDSSGTSNNMIIGNVISSGSSGILVEDNCTKNVVANNRVDIVGGGTTSADGILIQGSSNTDSIITGNHVTGPGRHGIFLNGGTRHVCSGNLISGCNNAGIRLSSCTNCTTSGNISTSNDYGLRFVTASTSNVTFNNVFTSNTTNDASRLTQTMTASADAIVIKDSIHRLESDANYTLSSAPTIADGWDGQTVLITYTGGNTVTLQDEDTLASSNLALGATSRELGAQDCIELVFEERRGFWIEKSFNGGV